MSPPQQQVRQRQLYELHVQGGIQHFGAATAGASMLTTCAT